MCVAVACACVPRHKAVSATQDTKPCRPGSTILRMDVCRLGIPPCHSLELWVHADFRTRRDPFPSLRWVGTKPLLPGTIPDCDNDVTLLVSEILSGQAINFERLMQMKQMKPGEARHVLPGHSGPDFSGSGRDSDVTPWVNFNCFHSWSSLSCGVRSQFCKRGRTLPRVGM